MRKKTKIPLGHRADALVAQALNMVKEHPGLAVAVLHRALEADPNHKPALQICGVIEHQRGNSKDALVHFEKLCKLDPNVGENWANLGTAHGGLGEFDKAIESIEKAVKMEPNQLLFQNNLAYAYKVTGKYREAMEIMQDLVKSDDKSQFWDNLGSLYADMEQVRRGPALLRAGCHAGQQVHPSAHESASDLSLPWRLEAWLPRV
jgi:Flp pilus assembly protein TadD